MATLEHIQEGYVYHDGERRRLYDSADLAVAQGVLLRPSIAWSVGPLTVHGSLYSDPLAVGLGVNLLDVTLVRCALSTPNPSCTVGGCVEGFRTELTVTLNPHPFSITITGDLRAPVAGCKSFNVTVPVGT